MNMKYEIGVEKLKCGDIIKLKNGETVIFKEATSDKLEMRVWHAPIDGKVLTVFNIDEPWKFATSDEQDYILDIMTANGYIWDKDENNFFSNPRIIPTNISSIVMKKPNELQPINIPDGYRAKIENGKIRFIKEFKDGDFIKTDNGSAIAIFKGISENGEIVVYNEYYYYSNDFLAAEDVTGYDINQWEYATEEDIKLFKEKLAKENYKLDEERTL